MSNTDLTDKEQEIINLNFRFRYLDRARIQRIFKHKYPGKINKWLKNLEDQQYLIRIQNNNSRDNSIPHIFQLDKKGVKFMKNKIGFSNQYIKILLKAEKLSYLKINHDLKAVDFAIFLQEYAQQFGHTLEYFTEVDLAGTQYKTIRPRPDGYFKYKTQKGELNCFVEIDLESETRTTFQRKVNDYIDYYQSDKWKNQFQEFPVIVTVCLTFKRKEDLVLDTEETLKKNRYPFIIFKFSTFDEIQKEKINSQIWKFSFGENQRYRLI